MTFKKYKRWVLEDPRSEKLNFEPDGRNHYTYRVSKVGEHYYGSKSELLGVLEESIGVSYFTSSNYLKKEFKSNPKDFKVKIIRSFDNPGDKILFESYLHQKFDVKNHDSFINQANQTAFGFDTTGRKCTEEEALQNRQQSIDYWHDPKLGEERRRQNGERNKKYWDKDENRLSRSIKSKDYWNDEELGKQRREENSIKNKNYWNDEELGEERKLKRSLKITGVNSKMARPIFQIDLKTRDIIKKWDYVKQAADNIPGTNSACISSCANGIYKSAGGFGWKYEDGIIATKTKNGKTKGSKHKLAKPCLRIDPYLHSVLASYNFIKEAAIACDILSQGIGHVLLNKMKTSGGFRWISTPTKWIFLPNQSGWAIKNIVQFN